MDTSRCYQHSIFLNIQRHNCCCKAFSGSRFQDSRPKNSERSLRQQQKCIQLQHVAHRQLQRLHLGPCSVSPTTSYAVRTLAHEPSTPETQALSEPSHLAGVGAAALLVLCTGGTALAAEAGDAEVSQGPDLLTTLLQGPDPLTTVLFSATILALLILTVGVVYLSVVSFFDKRAEDEARKRFFEAQKSRELQAANPGKPKVKRRRSTQDELSRGGGKGFGG